jgi:polar amino acid transport system substrate-binding protein
MDPPASPPLRVGLFEMPAVTRIENGEPIGIAVDIWRELADRIGRDGRFVIDPDIQTLVADTAAGRLDVLLGPLAVTEARERVVDFAHPLLASGMRIAVPDVGHSAWLAPIASVLSWQTAGVAAAVVGLVVLTSHLLWLVERVRNSDAFPRPYLRGVWEAMWWSVSTVITGGCEDKPVNTTAGRLVAMVWMLGGIGLVATLTGTIAAEITADRLAGVIHGPRDLAGRSVGVMAESVAEQSVRTRGGSVLVFPRLEDAFAAAAAGEVEAVVHENHVLQAFIVSDKGSAFRLVGPVFDSFDFAIAVPPGSPLRESLSTAILALREDGTLERLLEKWFGKHD